MGSGSAPASPVARETHGDFGSFPGLGRGNKNKSPRLMRKNDFVPGIYGSSLPLSSFEHQTRHNCGLDSDGPAENKLNPSGDKVTAGGILAKTFCKDHYKAAVEQLAALSLSKNTGTAQFNSSSNKQGVFRSWSYIHSQGNNSVNRDFNTTFAEMSSSSSDTPVSLISTHPALVESHLESKHQSVSYPGTRQAIPENCSRNGDGDFFRKARKATVSDSYPATDSSSDDVISVMKLNWKTGNSHREDKFLVEKKKDAAVGSENTAALLKYFRNANLNLRPEPIEDIETSSSAECDKFSYPDFLPAPYNRLDLQKLALSKWDHQKLSFERPLEGSLDKIILRLVEMERLQHLTILKERTKEPSVSPTTPLNCPSSAKDMYPLKQPKATDLSCPQAAFDGDFQRFGHFVREPDISKCACPHCHHKWNSGPTPLLRSKHLRACYKKCPNAPATLDSSNTVARRSVSYSGSSAKIRSAFKMPSPITPMPFSLSDSENSKCKQPRTRRKPCRKNVALMGKPFNFQKLNSLSVLSKPTYTQDDQE